MVDYEGLCNVDQVLVNGSINTQMVHGNIYRYLEINDLDLGFTATKNIDCIDIQINGCERSIIWYDDNVVEVQQPKKRCTYIWETNSIFKALDIALSKEALNGYKILR